MDAKDDCRVAISQDLAPEMVNTDGNVGFVSSYPNAVMIGPPESPPG